MDRETLYIKLKVPDEMGGEQFQFGLGEEATWAGYGKLSAPTDGG